MPHREGRRGRCSDGFILAKSPQRDSCRIVNSTWTAQLLAIRPFLTQIHAHCIIVPSRELFG